ncbi:type IV pilus biogenesis/stability protein PilW [Endozoicomonas sp. G2_1]|uniref:type IV pilus biogenesis/stability protein PilW n=1 Tax=Endozoicomonas sp. G2_1 TaxID=2821091 RepID=UPI001AD9A868|nr:type IV pilus biogenesis/stability protein PilW [Endozoicomonas sp. G2_1]MBO9489473.1 type IV pilus biogenesis/stability protein PilW [Endozoicomonas sp. G2_1]
MKSRLKIGVAVALTTTVVSLSGCVTQTYQNNKEPVVVNDATQNEIAMTRISLGLGYLKVGNTKQAKINLEKAKRFAPNLVAVYTSFAHYYETVGEPEQATQAYKKALSLDSDDADTLNNYGVFLCRQEKYDEAEKQFLKAISIPSYILVADSYENLALCQVKARKFDKAEHYLDKAIQHNPSSASALLQMTQLQYAKSDYVKAQGYFTRYEKATRRFTPDALALAYKIYQKQFKRQVAKNYGAMLVNMFANSYPAKQYLLNGLREIEADKLAQDYQASQQGEDKVSKKRVVVLSPKIQAPKKQAPKTKTVKNQKLTKVTTKSANPMADKSASVAKPDTKSEKSNVAMQVGSKLSKPETANSAEKGNQQSLLKPAEVVAKNDTDQANSPENKKNRTESQNQGQSMMTLPVHVVSKGESLFSISKKYNIHMSSLKRWNSIRRSNVIKIGQVIYLADPKKAVVN